MYKKAKNLFKKLYLWIFARKVFYKFNARLLLLNLNSIGILNYENSKFSGENYLLKKYFSKIKKPIVFDVGANIGNYSLAIYNINSEANIYAFEPNPHTFEKLVTNTSEKHISCINIGLGSDINTLELFDYKGVKGSSHASLYSEVFNELRKEEKTSIIVNISTLDCFCQQNNITKINFLKIDTEGNELNVLKGATQFLNSSHIDIIQFEFNDSNVISRAFLRDFLHLLPNYKFYRLLPNGFIPLQPYSPLFCELFAFQNIIAVHNEFSIDELS